MPLLQPPAPDLRPSQLTYVDGYQSIVSRVRRKGGSGSGGVVIFVGVDVDGLLASRILASLFRQDDVPYRVVPIGGYSELEAKRDEVVASEELHTLILLSLGSLLNLSEYFDLPPTCHLHIIDAHRPWNLDNLFGVDVDVDGEDGTGQGRLWVWGDGDEGRLEGVKKSWEALEYAPSDSDDSDDDDEDSEEEDEDDEDDDEEEEGDSDEENHVGEGRIGKRKRTGSAGPKKKRRDDDDDRPRKLPRAVKNAHIERVNKYYHAGTHYGASVGFTVYLLATVLERADNDLLWLAILAVTYQYVAAQIDRDKYEEHHELLGDEVARLNPPMPAGVPDADNRSIAPTDELRFALVRHWNLYDAMLHSNYIASRLKIWKEKGRKQLQGLLAKMGFSLQQCQQAYAHMDRSLKRDLPGKLESIAPEYGLVELVYPSFGRAFGFQMALLSAADAVEGLEALLEAAKGIRMEIEVDGGKGGGEWFGGMRTWSLDANGNGDVPAAEELETLEQDRAAPKIHNWHVQNFWTSYDACDDIVLLGKSLQLAKSLHRAIIRQGSAILDKTAIRPLRTFRFAAVREGPDLRVFCHPAPLSRLALWLVDATRHAWNKSDVKQGKKAAANPFVVACLNEDRGTFLVVGVTAAKEYGDVRKNKFGLAFQQAAEESGATYKHDMFDTSVVEVAEQDLKAFIEALQLHSAEA